MRTFVFAAFQPGGDLFQEIVEAEDELEATKIFVSEQGYMSWHETRRFDHQEDILDVISDEQDVYVSYIEVE